ncbi:Crp/Fnr family transcriptional regulator [Aquimarina hainanensis]|uniref:Crp/Fnr family transcriptional regulator n=1 Tax=Aquimarina hainanensis TaxID=1578017 RepID=A0ABW5N1V7_9FLAO
MNPIQQLTDKIHASDLWEKEICIPRNGFLSKNGTIDTNLYYIQEGSIRIYVIDETEEQTIRFGYRNNFIAALDSFISETPSELYLQAIKKTQIKVLRKKTFMDFIDSSSEYLNLWKQIVGMLIYQQMERERDILTSSPVERYQRVLKRSPQLFQEVPHKYIASYLRMSPETLSRIKKS